MSEEEALMLALSLSAAESSPHAHDDEEEADEASLFPASARWGPAERSLPHIEAASMSTGGGMEWTELSEEEALARALDLSAALERERERNRLAEDAEMARAIALSAAEAEEAEERFAPQASSRAATFFVGADGKGKAKAIEEENDDDDEEEELMRALGILPPSADDGEASTASTSTHPHPSFSSSAGTSAGTADLRSWAARELLQSLPPSAGVDAEVFLDVLLSLSSDDERRAFVADAYADGAEARGFAERFCARAREDGETIAAEEPRSTSASGPKQQKRNRSQWLKSRTHT